MKSRFCNLDKRKFTSEITRRSLTQCCFMYSDTQPQTKEQSLFPVTKVFLYHIDGVVKNRCFSRSDLSSTNTLMLLTNEEASRGFHIHRSALHINLIISNDSIHGSSYYEKFVRRDPIAFFETLSIVTLINHPINVFRFLLLAKILSLVFSCILSVTLISLLPPNN